MSKKKAIEGDINPDVDLADTFMSQVCETDLPEVSEEFKSSGKNSPDEGFSDYEEKNLKGEFNC